MFDLTKSFVELGITTDILTILLFIPIIATLINFSRYIIGFKTLGIYAPMTLSFAYVFTGIRFGLLITAAVIFATLLSYQIFKKVRMHYISRITINYSIVSFFIIMIIILNENLPFSFTTNDHSVAALPPLGILLIVALSDFFIKQYVKSGLSVSIRSLGETIIVAVAGWGLLRSESLQNFVLYNIWIQPIILMFNLLLGKYTGFRLKDVLRFRALLSRD